MMYSSGFAFAIKHKGKPLAEINKGGENCVLLPFGSEFEIFLKNKNDERAVVEMLVNGTKVYQNGDLVINGKDQVTVDCFQPSQRKLKFDREGCDGDYLPGDSDNGLVEVSFRIEKPGTEWKFPEVIERHIHHDHYYPYWPWYRPYYLRRRRWDDWDSPYWRYTTTGGDTTWTTTVGSGTVSAYYNAQVSSETPSLSQMSSEGGVIVQGGKSDQETHSVTVGTLSESKVTFRIRLVGETEKAVTVKDARKNNRCECGARIRPNDKFCSSCGKEAVEPVLA